MVAVDKHEYMPTMCTLHDNRAVCRHIFFILPIRLQYDAFIWHLVVICMLDYRCHFRLHWVGAGNHFSIPVCNDDNKIRFGFHDGDMIRSEEHTSELQSRFDLVCRLLLEKKKNR